MELLDGKLISNKIKEEIKTEVGTIIDRGERGPHLAAILVGEDPASQTYIKNKEKSCREAGIISSVYNYPDTIGEEELLENIDFLNSDPEVDGIIVQLPLPNHISESKVIEKVNPSKDVDGFHPVNYGRMALGLPAFLPATPFGIMQLIERYNIPTEGKHCVVLGRSNIVGSPISILMSRKSDPGNATVTICHSRTENIGEVAASADILIVAIGKPLFVTEEMVKKDAVVIDVGMHRMPSNKTKSGFKLRGDVDFDNVAKKCKYITPVPGGVGPMTIVALLSNTLKAYKKEIYP